MKFITFALSVAFLLSGLSAAEEGNNDDVGICIGIPDEENQDLSCRDHDDMKDECKNISGCNWVPLPKCGDEACVTLNTDDEDTVAIIAGVSCGIGVIVCCCLFGWVWVACGCCSRRRLKKRHRQEQQQRVEYSQEQDQVFAQNQDRDENFDGDNDNQSTATPDLVKDPEMAIDDDEETASTIHIVVVDENADTPTQRAHVF